MQELTRFDQNFKGCLVDYFLSAEDLRQADNTAPVLPHTFSLGTHPPGAPRNLAEAGSTLTTAIRYALHSLQGMQEADKQAAGDVLASIRLQMAAATRLQEAMYSAAFRIDPEQMRAFLMRERMPRTVAPFLQRFFRTGAGGTGLSGTDDGSAGDRLFADGFSFMPGQSPTSAATGCTVIVNPGQRANPGILQSAAPEQSAAAAARVGPQTPVQQQFAQPLAFPGPLPPPQSYPFQEPRPPLAQAEFQSPAFASFPSPRLSPFAPSPFTQPFLQTPPAFGCPPTLPFASPCQPWGSPQWPSDSFASPPSFHTGPGAGYQHFSPGGPAISSPFSVPPSHKRSSRGRGRGK
jgi:hypothetical protein